MPEFKEEIRKQLAKLQLPPTRENEIVEELAQHLQDQYDESIRRTKNTLLRCFGQPELQATPGPYACIHVLFRIKPSNIEQELRACESLYQRADGCALAGGFREVTGRFDLGAHGTGGEAVATHGLRACAPEGLRRGFAPVQEHGAGIGRPS